MLIGKWWRILSVRKTTIKSINKNLTSIYYYIISYIHRFTKNLFCIGLLFWYKNLENSSKLQNHLSFWGGRYQPAWWWGRPRTERVAATEGIEGTERTGRIEGSERREYIQGTKPCIKEITRSDIHTGKANQYMFSFSWTPQFIRSSTTTTFLYDQNRNFKILTSNFFIPSFTSFKISMELVRIRHQRWFFINTFGDELEMIKFDGRWNRINLVISVI